MNESWKQTCIPKVYLSVIWLLTAVTCLLVLLINKLKKYKKYKQLDLFCLGYSKELFSLSQEKKNTD